MQIFFVRIVSILLHKKSCWKTPDRFKILHWSIEVQFGATLGATMVVWSWRYHTRSITLQRGFSPAEHLSNKLLAEFWHDAWIGRNSRKRQGCFPETGTDNTGDKQMVSVNVHIKMYQEPARRMIAALNDSGTSHEFKQPEPDGFCPVPAEPLTKPAELQHCDGNDSSPLPVERGLPLTSAVRRRLCVLATVINKEHPACATGKTYSHLWVFPGVRANSTKYSCLPPSAQRARST